MKKALFIISAAALFSCGTSAQDLKTSDVPAAVKSAFEKLYPSVKDVDWEKEGANYEAEFDLSKVETSVVFDATGNLLETETAIAISELPKEASNYITKTHPGKKIKEAAKITAANGTVTYEAEVDESDLIFDAGGKFVKEIKESGEDKED